MNRANGGGKIRMLLAEDQKQAAPVTWGAARPVLLLPRDIGVWSDSQIRLALLHEAEHIRRGDWLVQTLAQSVCALFWFHPLAWYLFGQMRLEAELACDDAVLRADISPAEYAARLLEIVTALQNRRTLPAAIGLFRRSQVTGRIQSILAKGRSRGRATVKSFAAASTVFALLLLSVVLLRPMAAQQAERRMPTTNAAQLPRAAPRPYGPSGKLVPVEGGIEVELIGVGSSPMGEGSNWWRPDGVPLAEPPVMSNNRFHRSYTGAGEQYLRRSLFFRLHSTVDVDASTTGVVVDPAKHLDTDGYHHGRDTRLNDTHLRKDLPATGSLGLSLPRSETRITYRFGIAAGPWETAAVTSPPHETIPKSEFGDSGLDIMLNAQPELAYRDARGALHRQSLLGGHGPLEDVARRLLAFDSSGQEVRLDDGAVDYEGNSGVRISESQMARIAEFRLQTRPYQWAEFRDIALQPKAGLSASAPTPPVLPAYSHRFACGIIMEVPGVTERRQDGGRWWRPDGKRLAGPWKEFADAVSFQGWQTFPHPTAVLMRQFSRRNINYSLAWQVVPEARGWKGIRHISQEAGSQGGHSFVSAFTLDYPVHTNEAHLRIGVGTGAWKTVAVVPMPAVIRHDPAVPDMATGIGTEGDIYLTLSNHPEMITHSTAGERQRQALLQTGGPLGEVARRIIAVGKAGKVIVLKGTYEGGPEGESIALSFHDEGSLHIYNPFSLADVKEFRLQTRPYEWAEFRHIQLHPTP